MSPLSPILNMFGQSPIRPVQMHMKKSYECAKALRPFFAAVFGQDWPLAEQEHQRIMALEKDADNLKKDIRLHLPKSLFLPVPRNDLLELLWMQDQIPNKAKDIAGLALGRQMVFPATIIEPFQALLDRCLDACSQAEKAIQELDELLETGFRGAEAELVEDMITELDKIERATDDLQIGIRQAIFSIEKELYPVDVIFLYRIVEWTGDLADNAHNVGGQLELLLAH